MKKMNLIAVLAGLVAIGIFAADASAMYHPGVGVFISRDPGAGASTRVGAGGAAPAGQFMPRDQYRDGMNLYQYVRSNPAGSLDPTGLWTLEFHKRMTEKVLKKKLSCKCPCGDMDDFRDGVLAGVQYPDIPSGLAATGLMFLDEMVFGADSDIFISTYKDWLSYRSHFGDLQWWHGMASNEKTADELRKKIIDKVLDHAQKYGNEKDCEKAGLLLGEVMHTIQDTFAKSHAARNADWQITRFQDYGQQDSKKHGTADTKEGNVDQYYRAMNATARLINMIACDKGDQATIRQALENEILPLAKEPVVGGTENAFAK